MLPTGNNHIKKWNQGFTFIEIMLSVVVLSFGLVLILRSFATCLEGITRSEKVKTASLFLEEKMDDTIEMTRQAGGIVRNNISGEFNPEYKWDITTTSSEVSGVLNEVKIVISWPEGNNIKSIFATTFLDNKEI